MDSTKLKIEAELAELEHSNHGGGGEEEEEKEAGGGSDRIDLSVAVARPPGAWTEGEERRKAVADRWPAPVLLLPSLLFSRYHTHIHTHS